MKGMIILVLALVAKTTLADIYDQMVPHFKSVVRGESAVTKVSPPSDAEGWYQIKIGENSVSFDGDKAGKRCAQLALERLRMENGDKPLPPAVITDWPRQARRGIALDCASEYRPIAEIRELIDQAASLRFNRLKLRLADAQAWRIESNLHPELMPIPEGSNAVVRIYTLADFRALVHYAYKRGVAIIAEIDCSLPSRGSFAAELAEELGAKIPPRSGLKIRTLPNEVADRDDGVEEILPRWTREKLAARAERLWNGEKAEAK